jgi:signal peptidase I
LVAVIVAMAVRTFFIQPFKIPTGSMQPTLYGIYPPPESSPPEPYKTLQGPSFLEKIAGILFQGNMYEEYGYRSRGDHIFVDKISYHFRKPHRGEVIVFDTSHITELGNARGKFYIKRLIGLENDVIQTPAAARSGQRTRSWTRARRSSASTPGRTATAGTSLSMDTPGPKYLRTRPTRPTRCRPSTCSSWATTAAAAWTDASGGRSREGPRRQGRLRVLAV